METCALNEAHEKQRRAEAHLREGRFEAAIECHKGAANLLAEAYKKLEENCARLYNSTSSIQGSRIIISMCPYMTLESLALQQEYHTKQADIVRMKQACFQEYQANLELQQKELNKAANSKQKDDIPNFSLDKYDGSLRRAIYRTIEEQDSLLGLIREPDTTNGNNTPYKHPKDTGTVIEELKTVNSQLRSLIGSLLNELESKELQVQQLTERLQAITTKNHDVLHEDEAHTISLPPLPPMAPLEMPRFDFDET